jgi:hypothetical protein
VEGAIAATEGALPAASLPEALLGCIRWLRYRSSFRIHNSNAVLPSFPSSAMNWQCVVRPFATEGDCL